MTMVADVYLPAYKIVQDLESTCQVLFTWIQVTLAGYMLLRPGIRSKDRLSLIWPFQKTQRAFTFLEGVCLLVSVILFIGNMSLMRLKYSITVYSMYNCMMQMFQCSEFLTCYIQKWVQNETYCKSNMMYEHFVHDTYFVRCVHWFGVHFLSLLSVTPSLILLTVPIFVYVTILVSLNHFTVPLSFNSLLISKLLHTWCY
jgi:hypothetical protein